jgi:hypothetical protein
MFRQVLVTCFNFHFRAPNLDTCKVSDRLEVLTKKSTGNEKKAEEDKDL